ncbi:uncharacterized protein PHACADRAFT_202205, partial [Phanerochaete carnosa HHB-10118-sp]
MAAANVGLSVSGPPDAERMYPSLPHNIRADRCSMAHHPAEYGTLLVAALLSPRQTLLSTSDESEPPFSPEDPQGHKDPEISDQEWEIRTGVFARAVYAGRATYILQQTLPDFFATGLVSSTDVRPDPPAAV